MIPTYIFSMDSDPTPGSGLFGVSVTEFLMTGRVCMCKERILENGVPTFGRVGVFKLCIYAFVSY